MSDRMKGPGDWPRYFDAVRGQPARETLVRALDVFDLKRAGDGGERANSRLAVDLGAGSGRDTFELLRRGWRVISIDSSAEGLDELRRATPDEARDRLQTVHARYEDATWTTCELVNASFSIPHTDPAHFPALWGAIERSIKPGGRFAGQFFGVRDGWAQKPDGLTRTYHTREQVEEMLSAFEVEWFDEVEREGKNAFGDPKYWHVFHVVGRKRA
jgi:SAM-dependent methyltransferase